MERHRNQQLAREQTKNTECSPGISVMNCNLRKKVTFDSSKIGPSTRFTETKCLRKEILNQNLVYIKLLPSPHHHHHHLQQPALLMWSPSPSSPPSSSSLPTCPPSAIPVSEKDFIGTLSSPEYAWSWLPTSLTTQPKTWSSAFRIQNIIITMSIISTYICTSSSRSGI